MKSEKKSPNDLSTVPNGIVKDEPCIESCNKNTEEKIPGRLNSVESNELSDGNNQLSKNTDDKTTKRNQKANNNNQNTVKLENNSSYPSCNLSNDCGGGSAAQKSDGNVLGKCGRNGAGGGETQFMQQQSHIFVFSTMLANKGAEAVLRGQFPSIVAYHCAQQGTKKFLEKYPNKGSKFGHGQTGEWLNNFGSNSSSVKKIQQQQQQQQSCSQNNFPRRTPDLPILDPDPPSFWNEDNNLRNSNTEKAVSNVESSVDDTIDKVVNSQPSPSSLGEGGCPISGGTQQPSLQGVKVPDENLTPQQRQHREEQLATIRKMQILLFSNRKEEGSSEAGSTAGQSSQAFGTGGGASPSDGSLDNFPSGVDWDKIENQLFDSKENKVTAGENSAPSASLASQQGPRSQGPPPPYNQSSRPASVPAAALQSSNPSSPNNPTSTLSLPSPRGSSGLNSPADCGRFHPGGQRSSGYLPAGSPMTQDPLTSVVPPVIENSSNRSNPGTPASHSHLVSFSPAPPSATQKDSIDFGSAAQSPSVEDIFSQTLQSVGQEQREQLVNKEANLMPVPSPQQIQYLNTFEGQELTIQKQPNTSLKDGGGAPANGSTAPSSGIRGMLSDGGTGQCGSMSMSGGSPMAEGGETRGFGAPLPSPRTPRTPTQQQQQQQQQQQGFDGASATGGRMSSGQNSPASYGPSLTRGVSVSESPKPVKEASPSTGKKQLMSQHQNEGGKIPQEYCARQQTGVRANLQQDNLPLNPNNVSNCLGAQGPVSGSHFDPITSLAQMSQQLASLAPSGNEAGGIMHPGNPGGMQDIHGGSGDFVDSTGFGAGFGAVCSMSCTSYGVAPRPTQSQIQGIQTRAPSHSNMGYAGIHPGGYLGEPRGPPRTNVQVKPGAPNTIQYLPAAKPSPCNPGGPRPPPSLDFLQGFANNPPNQRFLHGNAQQQQPVYSGIGRPQRPPPGFHPGNYNPQMMRAPPSANPNMRMQHMGGGGLFPAGKPFQPGDMGPQISGPIPPRMQYMPNQAGIQTMMRPRGPAQPIHPSMEPGNNFKNGPYGPPPPPHSSGPPTSDPNYAQQYHNFQQQLYATGNRGNIPQQHSGLHLGTNSPSFLPER